MRVSIRGSPGLLAQATREALLRRGHELADDHPDCLVYLPGSPQELQQLISIGGFRRVVLRSHAYAYGSSIKNPGLMTEDRVSLLPENAPAQRWLQMERLASGHFSWAALRFATILAPTESDLLARKLASRTAVALAGHDPNVQFLSLEDAADALAAAVDSDGVGVFNIAGDGTIPLKAAFRAAGTRRIPVLKPLLQLFDSQPDLEQLQYNWTVSAGRAYREMGFQTKRSTVEALAAFLEQYKKSKPRLLGPHYDDWGLDLDYIQAWGWWFAFLRKVYWRIDFEGLDNIPPAGRALFVSNHRGFMPLDAVMHLSLILTHRQRVVRFLIIPSLLHMPFLCNFLTKLGGVIASQENAARLFEGENLVGIFPEGIRGAFTPYKSAYRLRDFSKSAYARIAILNQAPIIPAAVIGHAEIFPIIGRVNWSYLTREFGWPYLPIAPMFPLAPVPIPSKWHVRVLDPVPLQGLKPSDADHPALVRDFSRYIQSIVQSNIDQMRRRRKHIFWGRILDGKAPERPAFLECRSTPL